MNKCINISKTKDVTITKRKKRESKVRKKKKKEEKRREMRNNNNKSLRKQVSETAQLRPF